MAKTTSKSSPQRRFDVFPVWSTKNVKFKQKYQQYGQCLQTTFPFLMTMNKHLEGEYLNAISDVNVRDGKISQNYAQRCIYNPRISTMELFC